MDMNVVTIHNAKTNLSKLLKQVETGEEIIIARGNKEIARLSAINPVQPKNLGYGAWKGLFEMPDVLAPMTEEELAEWERPIEPSP
jgi:prevent-host-death family protein